MADNLPMFISPAQLDAARARADVQVVAVADRDAHARLRIPGALHIAAADFVAEQSPVVGLLPDDETLARAFSDAGLRNDAHIVAYDHGKFTPAARLLYTLHVMGHEALSLLDGGLTAWQADGFELDSGDFTPPAPSGFRAAQHTERVADHDWIRGHLDDPGTRLIDVRSADEYRGSDVRSARGGHIPGAVSLDWREFLQDDGRLKPEDELRSLLADRGVSAENESVHYCQSHMRSSFTYLVFLMLGHTRVRGYPGAWSDWGNREDTPISTADPEQD